MLTDGTWRRRAAGQARARSGLLPLSLEGGAVVRLQRGDQVAGNRQADLIFALDIGPSDVRRRDEGDRARSGRRGSCRLVRAPAPNISDSR